MANPTTNYSFAMPTNTDLVKDLPADFETFGQAVDTKIKDLNPETTAGDISYRGSTANAKTRLPIGTAGQVLKVNSGATAPEWGALPSSAPTSASAVVTTAQSISSSTYGDLTTVGPSVTLTTGTKALVIIGANITPASGWWADMSYAVSGATTVAVNNQWRVRVFDGSGDQQSFASTQVSLNAGSNTFTAKYADTSNGNGATFANRYIIVIDLGS